MAEEKEIGKLSEEELREEYAALSGQLEEGHERLRLLKAEMDSRAQLVALKETHGLTDEEVDAIVQVRTAHSSVKTGEV